MSQCTAPDCSGALRSSGSKYCEKHYTRMYRTGKLDANPWHRRVAACSIADCETLEDQHGLCAKHSTRVRRHGDPSVCIAPVDRDVQRGEAHHAWAGDHPSYTGAHFRVRKARGSVKKYKCVQCSAPARHWSYDHKGAVPVVDEQGIEYSGDPADYSPRCVPCHKRFDLDHKKRRAA